MAENITVYPTHTCFDDCTRLLHRKIQEDPSIICGKDWKIVHAIVKDSSGASYSHCWLEFEDKAFLSGSVDSETVFVTASRDEIYKLMRIVELKRYTIRQAYEMEKKFDHPGPWEKRFRDLCKIT